MTLVFKICPESMWQEALKKGVFEGAPIDKQDGYIHFSSVTQVKETAAKHFRGQSDLVLVAFDADRLGDQLKWETSRGGDLFPHLYEHLNPDLALWVKPLPLDESGDHIFPELD